MCNRSLSFTQLNSQLGAIALNIKQCSSMWFVEECRCIFHNCACAPAETLISRFRAIRRILFCVPYCECCAYCQKIDAIYTCEFSTFCFYFLVRICCGFSLVPYYCNFPAEITASSLQKWDVLKPLRFLLTKLYNCKYCSHWYFVTNCQSNKKEKIRSRWKKNRTLGSKFSPYSRFLEKSRPTSVHQDITARWHSATIRRKVT